MTPFTSCQHGIVYTETTVFTAPERFSADAPYQIAILDFEGEARRTVRISVKTENDRVRIGDRVEFLEVREGVPHYRIAPLVKT